ncbi:MAG: hypothetical protein A2498_01730 [Lentisphaerae bacterium RIFOXYC12_FULL_60_16]|nr:MAG: hypothetical protein A2498_01730 [Lentisphaerae bacterium RIFOXYC12_FULL_60_16]
MNQSSDAGMMCQDVGKPEARLPPDLPQDAETMLKDGGLLAVADALLKCPHTLLQAVLRGNRRVGIYLLLLMLGCSAAYGLTMGSFSGGMQLWAVPVKSMGMVLFSALLCLPSLYILAAWGGSDRTLSQMTGILLQSLGLAGLLLVGFAPIAWIFSQSTASIGFMGMLHLIFWGVSLVVGFRLIFQSFDDQPTGRPVGILKFWCVVFVAVLLQMSTVLRPVIGPAEHVMEYGKKSFITHLFENLDQTPARRR